MAIRDAALGSSSRPTTSRTLAAFGTIGARALADDLRRRKVAVPQAGGVRPDEHDGVAGAAVDRLEPHLTARLAHHAQHAMGALPQAFDQPRFGLAGGVDLEAHQQLIAHARRAGRRFIAARRQPRQRPVRVREADEQITVRIPLHHVRHAHGRERG